jgi:predicted alpha/beta superfamily hydrolase
MLYDASTSWNKQSWDADDVAAKLMQESKVQDFIIVGIWNGGKTRHADYFPQKPFESMNAEQRDFVIKQLQPTGQPTEIFQPVSDNYLKFLVTELKPFIDQKYLVYTDRKHTFVAGSSMGGLISMYAICEYPGVFGGAACLSTHWPGIFSMENNPVPASFVNYLKKNLPDPKNHKIYFDHGDQTLDAMYAPLQKKVDEVMKAKGFSGKTWETQFFPGKDHSEKSWNERLNIPLEFLLKK